MEEEGPSLIEEDHSSIRTSCTPLLEPPNELSGLVALRAWRVPGVWLLPSLSEPIKKPRLGMGRGWCPTCLGAGLSRWGVLGNRRPLISPHIPGPPTPLVSFCPVCKCEVLLKDFSITGGRLTSTAFLPNALCRTHIRAFQIFAVIIFIFLTSWEGGREGASQVGKHAELPGN